MYYIPLNIKSNYSLLNSLIEIKELISYAKKNNINQLGLCDTNLYGLMEFYDLAIKNGIKPIIGLDLKEIKLYIKNYNGYKNLCKIIYTNDLNSYSNDLICVVDYDYLDKYDYYKNIFDDIFVSYSNLEQRKNIKNKKCIYMNDIRCLKKEDSKYIKYAYMINDNIKISNYKNDFSNNYFDYVIDINKNDLINYKIFNDMCNLKIEKHNDLLPIFFSNNIDENLYLKKLCEKGLIKRLNNNIEKKYYDRLYYELDVINKMNFSNYFLVVWDIIKYAKKNNIMVGPGRGSSASSLVSYCLGITDIDPIKYDLFFERFLNPQRVTMPDIDIDFSSLDREKIIDYVKEKYGFEKVCNIITFSTLKTKQVLRDVAKIFDYNIDDFVNNFDSNMSLIDNKNNNSIIRSKLDKDTLLSRIFDISLHLENLKRHSSVNAAGIVISSKNIYEYIPVYNQNSTLVTGYTINYLEKLGFLKMDFLALENLDFLKMLSENTKVNLNKIPLNDKKTFELFNNSDTDGIFQFESMGIKKVLNKYKVSNFNDIIALIALYRPGPMENIDVYINRKNNKEKINYIHENLRDILSDTYGIIVYQEQIMQIARRVAGFSYSEADILRRAMSKKDKNLMVELKEKFIVGARSNGYNDSVSNEIYYLIDKFSNYGFNKAHSVCYGLISYRLAYFKANYFSMFMCYLMNINISNRNKIKKYIYACKSKNIKILKPDINRSNYYFYSDNNSIYYSLSAIKGISTLICKQIINERYNKPYTSLFDFIIRCNKYLDKKTFESLIHASAFDCFGYNHRTLINNINIIFNYIDLIRDLDESIIEKPELEFFEEYEKDDLINEELNIFDLYLTNHPLQYIRKNDINTNNVCNYYDKKIDIYLIINKKTEINTKKGDKMAFLVGVDEFNKIEVIIFPKQYERLYKINKGNIVLVSGKIIKDLNEFKIVANDIKVIKK